MASCEMCGSITDLHPALVENVELNLCRNCAGFGKLVKKNIQKTRGNIYARKANTESREIIQMLKEGFSSLIKEKREKLGLKQEEFAKSLAERVSIIHKIESGSYMPPIELARKIEKSLGISIVEEKQIEPQGLKASTSSYTIGDVIKIK